MVRQKPAKLPFLGSTPSVASKFSPLFKRFYLNFTSLFFLHCLREMAEWLKAAVLKTVEGNTSGGSNPSLPATP